MNDVVSNLSDKDQALVEDYVCSRLTGIALDEFELRMMDDVFLQDAVDLELKLARSVRAIKTVAQSSTNTPKPFRSSWLAVASAASVVIALGFIAGRYSSDALKFGGTSNNSANLLVIDTPRSGNNGLQVRANAAWLVLELPVLELGPYQVDFVLQPINGAQTEKPTLRFSDLRPDQNGSLRMVIRTKELAPGNWLARVQSQSKNASEQLDSRSFQITE